MKKIFNAIAATEKNTDHPTYVRDLEYSATGQAPLPLRTGDYIIEFESADGRKGKVLRFVTKSYHNAQGGTIKKVVRTLESDYNFLNLISWTGVVDKAQGSGVLSPLIYLDAQINEFYKIGKPTHKDVGTLLEFWDALVKRYKLAIKYRPDKPIPGLLPPRDMASILKKEGEKWRKADNKKLLAYLEQEVTKAQAAQNTDLVNELVEWIKIASEYEQEKVTLGRVLKAVVTGGLTEKAGRDVVAAITTGGLSQTKKGKEISSKVDEKVEKAEEKMDEVAKKVAQKFKTLTLALPRSAFASLAAINIFGIASHVYSVREAGEKGNKSAADKYKKTRNFWYKIGGSRTKFDKLIKNGSKKKPFLAKAKKKKSADGKDTVEFLFTTSDGYYNVAGIDDAAVAAWIGIATSVIAAVKSLVGKPPEMDDETAGVIDEEAAAEADEFNTLMQQEMQKGTPEALRDLDMVMPVWAWVGLGTLAVGTIGFIIYRIVRK